ncbi:hypothetical protein UFOVP531_36 [uncultured Caudovirales phage]|uniref:Uncharacterized protein n=1 Tax=uncultured Caudovirales phage TaxID=2100421 RepID=A0A6J5MV52_9CAUD|nr:hypothetical protein UFOVP531_36 [uncultured Caudovirales phage]
MYSDNNKQIEIMALSNTWITANEIYSSNNNTLESKEKITIYRSNGFEAFVIGETETAWLIDDNNGVKCAVKKSTTKNSLFKVNFDYKLRIKKR